MRGGIEGFSTLAMSFVMAGYFVGFLGGSRLAPQMIRRVSVAAQRAGVSERLETIQADMNEMTFEPASFDLVWSEGAIYFLGFEKGLARVRELVKPGGYVAVSEANAAWTRLPVPK